MAIPSWIQYTGRRRGKTCTYNAGNSSESLYDLIPPCTHVLVKLITVIYEFSMILVTLYKKVIHFTTIIFR